MAEKTANVKRRGKRESGNGSLEVERKKASDSDYSSESENVEQRYDRPCHKKCDSLFSSDSGFHNYRGLLNDCILLLVLSNSRNVITNLMKYGILVDPFQMAGFFLTTESFPFLGLLMVSWLFPIMAMKLEQLASQGKLSKRALLTCDVINIVSILTLPVIVVFLTQLGPVKSFLALGWYTVLCLKMVSYIEVNWWCRTAPPRKDDDPNQKQKHLVRYPDNLNLIDMIYFCYAPTLCYELNFPRTARIRKVFVIRRFLEAVFIMNVMMVIFQQWLEPTVLHSYQPFHEMDYLLMVERIFLLAVPNHLFWLLGFYWLFHSMLNFTGELLRFADRRFYGDWWNSQNLGYFWQNWNIPVHRWALRHLYGPVMRRWKMPKWAGHCLVFLLSAFFHEYLVSIPLLMLRPWAFVGMMAQVPLVVLTSLPYTKGQIGNVIVWSSIVLGQPIAILMYLHDYYLIHWVAPFAQNATAATA